MKKHRSIAFVLFIFIAGCSSGDAEKIPEKPGKTPIFNDQVKALEKAKGVEQMLQMGADKRLQNLDEKSQ